MKTKVELARELEERTKEFTIKVFKILDKMPKTSRGEIISKQLLRSASNIGANYREANRARSKADFRNKISICEAEASESFYWLEIIRDLDLLNQEDLLEIVKESNELLALFTSISYKLRRN